MNEINTAVLIPVIIYILFLLYIGFKSYRRNADPDEFLLSSRSLSIPAFVATLVTTWYGGILGVGEFVYSFGISALLVFGLPYYIFAGLFAFFLAPKIRRANNYSIPDMLYNTYNRPAGILGSLFLVIMTSPAPYILMVATLLQHLFHLSFLVSTVAGTLFSIIYVYWGGFRSVVQTDKLQFVLMFTGFLLLTYYALTDGMSFANLIIQLDEPHKSITGGLSFQSLIVWFLIASWTFIDPGFHQRCAAAKTPGTARKGILISIGFWFIFDMLTTLTGLYAFVLLPGIDPLTSYPMLAQRLLPPFFQGIFFIGLLAIIMSTVDSYTFLSALTFGRDIIWKWNKDKNEKRITLYTRIGLIITAIISIILIFLMPSVIEIWYNLGSLFIPPLLLPLVTAYFPRWQISSNATMLLMCLSFVVSLVFFVPGQMNSFNGQPMYPFGLEPFFPGLIVSLAGYAGQITLNKIYGR
ncbi:MAG: sodium:solute symporter [Calditrichaceae bacterium]